MSKLFPTMVLAALFALSPAMLFAQGEAGKAAKEGPSTSKSGTMQSDSGKKAGPADKMKRHERRAEERKKIHEKLDAMDKRLDEKVAAMNSATGDQKITAISDVINELISQRKEMRAMFKSHHGDKMMHGGMHRMHGEKHGRRHHMMDDKEMKDSDSPKSGPGAAKQ